MPKGEHSTTDGHTFWHTLRRGRDRHVETARKRIGLDELTDALTDTDSLEAAADWLGVDEDTLGVRILSLTSAEEEHLDHVAVRKARPGERDP